MSDSRGSTTVLLVRHGRTPTTGELLPGRSPGLHLSEQGWEQARAAAERIAELPVSALYSSPLERARETAQPSAELLGLPVREDPALLELDVGQWTGRALNDLNRLPEWRTVQHNPSAFRFPDGESFPEMQQRMVDAVQRLCTSHPGGTVVCFSHADPIRGLLAHAMGTPLDNFQRLSVGPCSISVLSYPAAPDGADEPPGDDMNPVVLTVNSTRDSLRELVAS